MNVPELFCLKDKVALVTGGAGIYGAHITEALAEAGAHVIIASRNIEQCSLLADKLRKRELEATPKQLDLAFRDSMLLLKTEVVRDFGKIDILFNNAVARAKGDMSTITEEQCEETMRVNWTGLFTCCKIFGEEMIKRCSGAIINIASIYGTVGPDFSTYEGLGMTSGPDYAFAKGGLINLTRYLASYYGRYNIRVNSISPGGYRTSDISHEFAQRYSAKTLLGRMAGPDDIKGPAVFLASDASAYVTGINLMVDGGWTAI